MTMATISTSRAIAAPESVKRLCRRSNMSLTNGTPALTLRRPIPDHMALNGPGRPFCCVAVRIADPQQWGPGLFGC
jgi:hypothetical protein